MPDTEKIVLRGERIRRFIKKSEFSLMVLGFLYLAIYSVQVLVQPPGEIMGVLNLTNTAIYGIFVLDLAIRFFVEIPQFRKLSGWVTFFKHNWLSILAALGPHFRGLRVLQVLIVLRGVAPYMVNRSQRVGLIIGVTLPLVLYTAALSALEAERGAEGSNINTFGDAVWWSVVSVTTVGYGDSYPVTTDGRVVAGLLMFLGIALFSSLTALIAAWVVEGHNESKDSPK
jgi:voltage-gated potassium channel